MLYAYFNLRQIEIRHCDRKEEIWRRRKNVRKCDKNCTGTDPLCTITARSKVWNKDDRRHITNVVCKIGIKLSMFNVILLQYNVTLVLGFFLNKFSQDRATKTSSGT